MCYFIADVVVSIPIVGSNRSPSWKHNIVLHVQLRRDHAFTPRIKDLDVTRTHLAQMSLVATSPMASIITQATRDKLR